MSVSWWIIAQAWIQTLTMVAVAGSGALLCGLPLGVALFVTRPGQILANPKPHLCINALVNATRSIPFIILLVAMIPITRMLVGTSIGTQAAIVPLTIAAIPFMARMVDGVLAEVPSGLTEAMIAMGATPWQMITKGLLPESLPGLINALTLTLTNLIGYSAMAGTVGGGGLGDLAIRYGYHRFDTGVMAVTVILLIIMVQGVQWAGDQLAMSLRR